MEEHIIFRSTIMDSRLFTGQETLTFFQDDDDFEKSESISTSLLEAAGIKWLFDNPKASAGYLFFEELNISTDYKVFTGIERPIIKDSGVPGDIDILLINEKDITRSIAFQVKRVKGKVQEDNSIILKTHKIEEGVKQTKMMYEKYRFHKTYLMLLIVVDASNRKDKQSMFRYTSEMEKEQVYYHSGYGDLNDDIGIYMYEISQPTNKSIDLSVSLCSKELRKARPIDQLQDTTNRIKQLLKNPKN